MGKHSSMRVIDNDNVNSTPFKLRGGSYIALKDHNDIVRELQGLLTCQKKELEAALASVKQLEEIIPVCSYCKKIRGDDNTWRQFEHYFADHFKLVFSHGICPHCIEEQMEIFNKLK